MDIKKISIPPFVDKWIKGNNSQSWWRVIARWENEVPEEDKEVYGWYSDYNEDDFIVAWVTKVYVVEEEPLYFVEFTNISSTDEMRCLLNINHSNGKMCIGFSSNFHVESFLEKYLFTEREIKKIDERYWTFAVPVEEEQ